MSIMLNNVHDNVRFLREISYVLQLVTEFHKKYDVGIGSRSQEEMYFRCNLLLEELAELAIAINQNSNLDEELADVYYVLAGNMIAMGFDISLSNQKEMDIGLNNDISYQDVLIQCGLIARSVRKRWSPFDQGYLREFYNLHLSALDKLYKLAYHLDIADILKSVETKHEINMKRTTRKVGGTQVISHWQ